jgi:hypothetical protein
MLKIANSQPEDFRRGTIKRINVFRVACLERHTRESPRLCDSLPACPLQSILQRRRNGVVSSLQGALHRQRETGDFEADVRLGFVATLQRYLLRVADREIHCREDVADLMFSSEFIGHCRRRMKILVSSHSPMRQSM